MYRGTRGRRYSAVMLNFNVLLYLLLQECTRDIAKVALSKMAMGRTDGRTSAIYALTGLALGCCPLFFIFTRFVTVHNTRRRRF